ncbi:MAG TPA: hypothetical protein VFW33_05105 [Gemmataceae bacterium]|nr:hypothetical protein [Gemmataceae bacterium]
MTTRMRTAWRVITRGLAGAAVLAACALGVALFAGGLAQLTGSAAPAGEFRVLDTQPAAAAAPAKAAPDGGPSEVQLTDWENTAGPSRTR